MKRAWLRKYVIPLLIALVWLLGPGAQPAQAYIDPGTGSSLLSSLGLLLGVMTTFIALGYTQARRCGGWVWAMIVHRRRHDDDTTSEENSDS